MLTLLHRFAALTLILTVLHTLLPEGVMRRTALMCAALIAALCWLDALSTLAPLPSLSVQGSILTDTTVSAGDLSAAMEVYARQAERSDHAQ